MKRLLLILAVLALVPSVASAVPAYCPSAPLISVNDVTFRGQAADGCWGIADGVDGVGGGSSLAWDVNQLNLFGGGWDAYVRDNNTPATLNNYLGINWTLSAPQAVSGDWTLTLTQVAPNPFPVAVDIGVVLKSSTDWAMYYFPTESFFADGINSGHFTVTFALNRQEEPQAMSHMTLYFRDTEVPQVPEPASMLLLGSGLFGLAGMARRRRR